MKTKLKARKIRHHRIRKTLSGTSAKPRLVVFRSLKNISCQIIDDTNNHTLVSASSSSIKEITGTGIEQATLIGTNIAKEALKKKITSIVFDRNGYKYHGRVKALAESARETGLKF